jgi:hypothetical protein
MAVAECCINFQAGTRKTSSALAQKREIEQTKNAVFRLDTALVVVKVKSVDSGVRLQPRRLEAAFDGAAVAGLQFHIASSSSVATTLSALRHQRLAGPACDISSQMGICPRLLAISA